MHDENAYDQSIPCAAINGGGKSFKVEEALTFTATGETLVQGNVENLYALVFHALKWVEEQHRAVANAITKELEQESLETLLARPQAVFRAPTLDEIWILWKQP